MNGDEKGQELDSVVDSSAETIIEAGSDVVSEKKSELESESVVAESSENPPLESVKEEAVETAAEARAEIVASPADSDEDSSSEKQAESSSNAEKSSKNSANKAKSSRSNSGSRQKNRGAKSNNDEAIDNESVDDDEVSSNDGQAGSDDPMGEAYCLDDGSLIDEGSEEVLPWRSDVKSPREFFSTEILYRYDILEAAEQNALVGSYRLELKGNEGGIWSISVNDEITVENTADSDAEIVISMNRNDFMNIINGRLNPQLAILAQKIKVKGDTRRAVIFQSLLTPTPE